MSSLDIFQHTFPYLSTYSLWCLVLTIFVLVGTVLFQYTQNKRNTKSVSENTEESLKNSTHKATFQRIQHEMYSKLDNAQLEEEKRVEEEQLAAIFDLLKKTENDANAENFRDQLKLYHYR